MLHTDIYMVEELQESDVLWPDDDDDDDRPSEGGVDFDVIHKKPSPCRNVSGLAGLQPPRMTKPVRVPVPSHLSRSCVSYFLSGGGADDCIKGNRRGGGMISATPPHVLTSRRMMTATDKMAFSMCSGGRGRTLKGRDLRRVRDAVLMKTGFLET